MEPFNIKLQVQHAQITLTILPNEGSYFKIVYYGGILGAIRQVKSGEDWELVPTEEIITGDLPPYANDSGENRVQVKLNYETIVKIGREIEKTDGF